MKGKTLSWNDRLTILAKLQPSDADACRVFGVTQDELNAARTQLEQKLFSILPDLDVESYRHLFSPVDSTNTDSESVTSTKAPGRRSSSTTTTKGTSAPETATKTIREPKKRGRKGDKILKAFSSIPATPVAAEEFARQHGVSIAVLRQSKRFDATKSTGTVRVKKDKGTKTLMIWREEE